MSAGLSRDGPSVAMPPPAQVNEDFDQTGSDGLSPSTYAEPIHATTYPTSQPSNRSAASWQDEESGGPSTRRRAGPYDWMGPADEKNDDDDLHDPAKPLRGSFAPARALVNVGAMIVLLLCILMLFAGYPILHYYTDTSNPDKRAQKLNDIVNSSTITPDNFMVSRVNSTKLSRYFNDTARMLIDPDTPVDAYTMPSTFSGQNGKEFRLVFSDEFNTDGRSFYAGDDPFWEAVDLHYWATGNFEWYDPAAVYTKNGTLRIRLEQHEEHNLYFRGGMLQSWNKFCFRNGILIASVQLPGYNDVAGLWPAFWLMGNLGRAGYGASLEGMWPYSYDQCDIGTVMNQTIFNSTCVNGCPDNIVSYGGATTFNQRHNTRTLSFLPGQKLSRCTCLDDKDMHPGPIDKVTGELVGRSAPEIDVFEAQTSKQSGVGVSQSLQIAPYNWQYNITHDNTSLAYRIFNYSQANTINIYNGEVTQQSLSGVHLASQQAVQYEAASQDPNIPGNFATYSLEFKGGQNGYAAWTSAGNRAWELYDQALIGDSLSKVGPRQFPKEPMYILLNLGISRNFDTIDWENVMRGFPFEMSVDWVRVYQDPDDPESDVGCDPPDMPTLDYINKYREAYTNANYTMWGGSPDEGGYGQVWPRNRLYSKGCAGTRSTEPGDPDATQVKAPWIASASVTAVPAADLLNSP